MTNYQYSNIATTFGQLVEETCMFISEITKYGFAEGKREVCGRIITFNTELKCCCSRKIVHVCEITSVCPNFLLVTVCYYTLRAKIFKSRQLVLPLYSSVLRLYFS